jgi:hypothetical protein
MQNTVLKGAFHNMQFSVTKIHPPVLYLEETGDAGWIFK